MTDESAAIAALVGLSRAVADVEEGTRIAALLADWAAERLGARCVAVWVPDADGESHPHGPPPGPPDGGALELRGCAPREVAPPDLLAPETWRAALRQHDLGTIEALPLASGGGLFGVMVLGWPQGHDPTAVVRSLAAGLGDIAAVGLDRAFRTRELRRTIVELDARRSELARTEALRHLGQMAAVVAHEVKNPLASMSGVLQVLRTRFPEGTQEHGILGKLLDRLAELGRMVEELLHFARPTAPTLVDQPIEPILRDVASWFGQDRAYGALDVAIAAEPVSAPLDRGMVQRLLTNLVLNAAQAMDGRGRVVLGARRLGDDRVEITVADDGPGVPTEIVDRMFEPFVTTKTRGSGLGLAIARQVAEAHGGDVTYRRSPSGGACFAVTVAT